MTPRQQSEAVDRLVTQLMSEGDGQPGYDVPPDKDETDVERHIRLRGAGKPPEGRKYPEMPNAPIRRRIRLQPEVKSARLPYKD